MIKLLKKSIFNFRPRKSPKIPPPWPKTLMKTLGGNKNLIKLRPARKTFPQTAYRLATPYLVSGNLIGSHTCEEEHRRLWSDVCWLLLELSSSQRWLGFAWSWSLTAAWVGGRRGLANCVLKFHLLEGSRKLCAKVPPPPVKYNFVERQLKTIWLSQWSHCCNERLQCRHVLRHYRQEGALKINSSSKVLLKGTSQRCLANRCSSSPRRRLANSC